MKKLTLYFYRDKAGKFRWRLKSRNGKVVGASSEGFSTRMNCHANYHMCGPMMDTDVRYSKDWFARGKAK